MARGASRQHTAAMVAKKRAIVYLDLDLHKALRTESAKMDLTVSELVNIAVRTGLADGAAFQGTVADPIVPEATGA
jgi:hypothetical protein